MSQPSPTHPSLLDQAKDRATIFDVLRAYGLQDGETRLVRSSPVRPDKKPSFSIRPDGKVAHDFATGEAFDVIGLIMRILGCSPSDAARELIRIAALTPAQPVRKAQAKKLLRIPPFFIPSIDDMAEIQHVRGWPVYTGLHIANQRGLLHRCTMTDDGVSRSAWAITDSARRSIQVRRMDGQPWTWNNAKAWTLGGSIAGWPIGAADIGDRRLVLFCEGGPDFLAAHTLAWLDDRTTSVAVVCVPGATASLHPDALPFFTGKHVRIFEHADDAGSDAGQRWAAQLKQAGATVDGFTFEPPHKDLADLLAATDGESLDCPADVFEGLPKEDSPCR
ncbi:MAG: hypothetical protein WC661_06345 [Opitutaceae bacterium]|jgi:hypothetical protein